MQIKSYKNASSIEERYIPQLAERQRECWGAKPFEEYKICNNSGCRAIFSTEEVLGGVMEIRNLASGSIDFKCKECGDNTGEIYEKEDFIKMIQEYLLGKVSALLVVDTKDNVEGFGVISKTNIRGVMELEFNTRPSSYQIDDTIKQLSHVLYGDESASEQEVICFHQIYVSPLVRDAKLSYQALKDLFDINRDEYKDIPLIGEPRYDNRFYPILRTIGWENITHDKYGYVIQYLKKYGDMVEFLDRHNGYEELVSDMLKYKKEARGILKDNKSFSERKFYK